MSAMSEADEMGRFVWQHDYGLCQAIKAHSKPERDKIAVELRKVHRENPRIARLLFRRMKDARAMAMKVILDRIFNSGSIQ